MYVRTVEKVVACRIFVRSVSLIWKLLSEFQAGSLNVTIVSLECFIDLILPTALRPWG